MRTHYVLIDFENVQPDSIGLLKSDQFKVLVFVGANQSKLPFSIASALQEFGSRAQYVKISGSGADALDFHIAYYIGKLAAADSAACFHIVSKDTGFDPLIQHLKSQKTIASRVSCIEEIPLIKATNGKTLKERTDTAVSRLQQLKLSKPRTLKTLTSALTNFFRKELSEQEIQNIVKSLVKKGYVIVTDQKVTYKLPK